MLNAKSWIGAVIKPKETFAAEKANASIKAGLANFAIAALVAVIILFIGNSLRFGGFSSPLLMATSSVPLLIGELLTFVLVWLVGAAILNAVSKQLGGTGTYTQTYYLISLYAVPTRIFFALTTVILTSIGGEYGAPIMTLSISTIVTAIGLLVFAYTIYLLLLVLKETYGYTMEKALASLAVSAVIGVIILAVLGSVIYVALMLIGGAML